MPYTRENFVPTPTGNRISPVGHKIIGLSKIMVMGKTIIEGSVTMRGDLSKVNIGSYCVNIRTDVKCFLFEIVCENSVLKPSGQISDSTSNYFKAPSLQEGVSDTLRVGKF